MMAATAQQRSREPFPFRDALRYLARHKPWEFDYRLAKYVTEHTSLTEYYEVISDPHAEPLIRYTAFVELLGKVAGSKQPAHDSYSEELEQLKARILGR